MKTISWIVAFTLSAMLWFVTVSELYAQTVLEADGPGNTYELITNVFAPGNGTGAVEAPDCAHPEFGRHIVEVWDAELNQYVFEFIIHVTPDNDRCLNFDRQRVEIKTYEASPENLIGRVGETVTYRWKFRLPIGFQPSSSFTHIHQIKAVGGDDGDPIFTLTPRKGNPNKLELIHNNVTKVKTVDLSLFEGVWVECEEKIFIDSVNGTYSMTIRKVNDGTVLLNYSNPRIMTIRSTNNFIRPKWGIYRSLNNVADLRDEAVRFAGFSIQENTTSVTQDRNKTSAKLRLTRTYPNPFNPHTVIQYELTTRSKVQITITDVLGRIVLEVPEKSQEAGLHTFSFDGSMYSSGLYIANVRVDEEHNFIKMLLLK